MDLTFLRALRGARGPVASLILNASRDSEDAEHAVRVRWGKARDDLHSQGADEATLTALDPVMGATSGVPGPHGHVAFAADGEVLAQAVVAEPPQDYRARLGPLPDPLLYLYSTSPRIAYVLAVVDSLGADLWSVHGDGRTRVQRVEGKDWPINKVREGGYHHKQMQRTVENRVADNAGRVAGAVAQALRDTGAEIAAIAGEVQVRGEVHARLPDWAAPLAVDLEFGARPEGSHVSGLDEELRGVLDDLARRRLGEAAESFRQGRGNDDRVAEGLADVVPALQRGQVGTLLWSTANSGEEPRLWFGPSAEQIALTEQEVRDMGVDDPVKESAGPVLLRAAAAGSSDLLLIGEDEESLDLTEGIGALLRFNDPTLGAQ